MNQQNSPNGELTLKNIARPKDTNSAGDIFGGWLLSQMDLAGSVMACKCATLRFATVGIDKMVFLKPVFIGDVVNCYASIVKRGNTSVSIQLEVWAERVRSEVFQKVAEGLFTFVGLDESGKPTRIEWRI